MIIAKSRGWQHVFRQRTAIRLGLAGGLAVLALFISQAWLEGRAGAAVAAPGVAVLVTARAIEAGSIIGSADLRWQAWPAALVSSDWLVKATGASAMIGRVAPARLAPGVPITRAMTVMPGPGSAFAAAIRPGRRAISIAVTPAGGLAGFVTPGDRVDVLLTQSIGNRRTVQTLLADIGVLGVDQRGRGTMPIEQAGDVVAEAAGAAAGAAADGAAPAGLVTLEVMPRQAQALAVAAELGRLSLVLRGPAAEAGEPFGRRWDSDVTGLSPAQLVPANDVVPAGAAPTPVQAAPARAVSVIYGVQPAGPAPAAVPAK